MKRRPKSTKTVNSIRSSAVARSRPTSAKDWFETNNQKRNEEAWKHEELVNMVADMKNREFQAKFYTSLGQIQRDNTQLSWKMKEENDKKLEGKKERLRKLLAEDEKRYEEEREEKRKKTKKLLPHSISYPEIELLKKRLEELKRQNEEERKKVAEKLSYEAWRKNNPDLRKIESERFSRFVRDAWVDQKQWREDERRAREAERRQSELAAAEEERRLEEEERERKEKQLQERLHWKSQLEEQIRALREREEEENELRKRAEALEREKFRLQELINKRERIKEERKRKHLDLFWARQFQLKLKKKTADILSEIAEDEMLVEDLLRPSGQDAHKSDQFNKEEGDWMFSVLEEQKRLEELREKEYHLLFSEEAERMFRKREVEWQKEQQARDKLMEEVMHGLKKQVSEKIAATERELEERKSRKETLMSSIDDSHQRIKEAERKEEEAREERKKPTSFQEKNLVGCDREFRREEALRDRQIEDHQKEMARLEAEMQRLWQQSYVPPKFGRKNTGLVMKPIR